MATTVTSKGQATIPKDVRKALGIVPGSRIDFVVEDGSARIVPVRNSKPSKVEDGPQILGYKGKTVTLEEMDEAIAAGAAGSL
jgi:AbrB family looped-hinge helix DNA binding protein